MTDTSFIVVVTLLAVLVGGALPVFYQLLQTLRSARRFLDRTGHRLERSLDQVSAAATRVDRLGAVAEEHAKGLKPAVDAISEFGQSMHQMRDSLRATATIASALGPTIVTILRSMRNAAGDDVDSDRAASRKAADGKANGKSKRTAHDPSMGGAGKEEGSHGIQ